MSKGAWVLAAFVACVACGGKGQNPLTPAAVNRPPEIRKIELVGYNVAGYGSSLPLSVTVADPDGDEVRCTYRPEAGQVLINGASTSTCVATYVAPAAGLSDQVGVTATDSKGASTGSSAMVALGPSSIAAGAQPTPAPPGPAPTPQPTPTPPPPPPGNNAPTVTVSATTSSCHPRPSTACTVAVTATGRDPDGDPLTYSWSGCAAGSGTTATCTITAPGGRQAKVQVNDGRGGIANGAVDVAGVNTKPTVSVSGGGSCHPTCTATFSSTATDADGDPLTYSWGGCASGTATSSSCAITTLATVTATVTVSDGWEPASASGGAQGTNATPQLFPIGCTKIVGYGQLVDIAWSIEDDDATHICDAYAPAPDSLQILSAGCYTATVRSRNCAAEGLPPGCYGVIYLHARDPWGAVSPNPPGCMVQSFP